MNAAEAAAADKWVREYERDYGRPGSPRRVAASAAPIEPADDYEALYPTDELRDRQRAVASASVDALSDDEIYASLYGDEPEPSRELPPVERPYAQLRALLGV